MPLRVLIIFAHALLLALAVAVAPSTGTASEGHGRVYVAAKANCTQDCPEAQHWLCATWARFVVPMCAAKPDLDKLFESVPQRRAVQDVRARLERKAADPSTPALFVFAGDSGVGKTRMAHLLSLATSACSGRDRAGQPRGKSLFEIDSAAVGAGDPASARKVLMPKLLAHMRRHPNGIVLVDHFQLMGDVLDLTPVLTGGHYPEDTSVSFQGATVILTMNFSVAGTTQLMSVADVESAAYEVLERLPQVAAKTLLRRALVVPFVAFGPAELHQAITDHLMRLPCRHPLIEALHFTWDDVNVLTQHMYRTNPELEHGNGRIAARIADVVRNECILAAQEAAYRRTGAHVGVADLPAFKCRLRANADGSVEAQVE
jgi:hypothetical protein